MPLPPPHPTPPPHPHPHPTPRPLPYVPLPPAPTLPRPPLVCLSSPPPPVFHADSHASMCATPGAPLPCPCPTCLPACRPSVCGKPPSSVPPITCDASDEGAGLKQASRCTARGNTSARATPHACAWQSISGVGGAPHRWRRQLMQCSPPAAGLLARRLLPAEQQRPCTAALCTDRAQQGRSRCAADPHRVAPPAAEHSKLESNCLPASGLPPCASLCCFAIGRFAFCWRSTMCLCILMAPVQPCPAPARRSTNYAVRTCVHAICQQLQPCEPSNLLALRLYVPGRGNLPLAR